MINVFIVPEVTGAPVSGTPFDDVVEGTDGFDIFVQSGPINGHTITFGDFANTLEQRSTGSIDTLIDIEQVAFDGDTGGQTTLDLTLFAGILDATETQLDLLAAIYVALFDRTPDAP